MAVESLRPHTRDRWHDFASGSINRRILSAAAIVAGLTLLTAIAAMGKELLVAATFGTSDALDAFLIALSLPTLVINIIAGSFGAALVPIYIRVHEHEGPVAAQKLLSSFTLLGGCLLFMASIIL